MHNSNAHRGALLGTILLLLALLAVVLVGVMIFGAHLGLWEPIVGFGYFRNYLNPIGYVITGISLLGFIYLVVTGARAGKLKSGIALLLGVALLAPMLMDKINPPASFPPIHDITTDTENPPQFLVLDDSRPGALNSLVYEGEPVAAQQREAYPFIGPILTDLSATEAFSKALSTAKIMGWDIVAQDDSALRFEASARTPIFQFVDDIVVVVSETETGSRIDVRSVSRVGRGDRGANAIRIATFTKEFEK